MITEVKLKPKIITYDTLRVSDKGELKYAVILDDDTVVGLFAHKNYAENYIRAEGLSASLTIREVAE